LITHCDWLRIQCSALLVAQFFAVLLVYPETKGFTLEEMQKKVAATG
jgi:hypothetical protein